MQLRKKTSASKTWGAFFLISIVLLAISRPLTFHSTSLVSLGAENHFEAVPLATVGNTNDKGERCAYVFYASDDAYACGALVNMARLQKTLPRDVDLIMVAFDSVSTSIREVAIERFGAWVYNSSSFGKEETYRRLIMIDADSLILRPPNHLFNLPDELPLAVPSAYWLRPQYISVTNWFMSVRPSKEMYIKLQKALQDFQAQGREEIYDMDLLNEVFAKDITVLPPIYGLLDSEFGENDEREFGSLEDILQGETSWAVHFTAGKPMLSMLNSARVAKENPNAHAGHAALFEMWNTEARAICPQGTYPSGHDTNK